jgi:NitT/TauT family transport system substrate-binding protein
LRFADGIGNDLIDFSAVDPMPVFMAATPDFVQSKPDVAIAYLKAWLDVAQDFKNAPQKVADLIYKFYADKGYTMSLDAFSKALSRVEVNPGFPRDLEPYMQQQAGTCSRTRRSNAIPDWKTALRPDFMERARAAS